MFTNPEDFELAYNHYFAQCEADEKPYTITGLALALGFESRQSFYDYEKNPEFSYIVRKARLKVEQGYELRLFSGQPTGAIFALKNMGWKDKQEISSEDGSGLLLRVVYGGEKPVEG